MHSFEQEYDKRKDEINSYISLLQDMDRDGASIVDIDKNTEPISPLSHKVCKASFFLILYNLVEATVTAGVKSIYDKIEDEKLDFISIMENLRKVWWHSKNESLSSCARSNLIDGIYNFYCEAHSGQPLNYNGFVSGVSGNLDAEMIREVCRRYGLPVVSNGRDLVDVKKNRNWLAHGDKSFSEIGQDTTPSDLLQIRDRTYIFLDEYVDNVKNYLLAYAYRVSV